MQNRVIAAILAMVTVLAYWPVIFAQTAQQSGAETTQTVTPPPDLSGVWMRSGPNSFDIKEEPSMQPWAKAVLRARKRELDPTLSCFPNGVPRILLRSRPFEFIQTPGRLLMVFERNHWLRHIYMDGREHPQPEDLYPVTWMGHSIGRWEGDTLVVDTVGVNDKTWVDNFPGHPRTEEMRVVERYRRSDHNTLVLNITIDDPKTYTRPWTGQKVFELKPDWEIWEHVQCEERLELTPWTETEP